MLSRKRVERGVAKQEDEIFLKILGFMGRRMDLGRCQTLFGTFDRLSPEYEDVRLAGVNLPLQDKEFATKDADPRRATSS